MADSAVELPDPLESSQAVTAAGADDLLSQLAGEEIDRLLAEADSGNPGRGKARTKPPAVPTGAGDPVSKRIETPRTEDETDAEASAQVESQLDALFAELKSSPAASVPAAAVAARSAVAAQLPADPVPAVDVASQLDALFAELNQPAQPGASAPEASAVLPDAADTQASGAAGEAVIGQAVPAASADEAVAHQWAASKAESAAAAETVASAPGIDFAADEEKPQTTAAEKVALGEGEAEGDVADEAAPAPVPLWLKPLVWLNAPLSGCSPAARALVGKAAIVTLINALAVLGYVVFFRK